MTDYIKIWLTNMIELKEGMLNSKTQPVDMSGLHNHFTCAELKKVLTSKLGYNHFY